MNRKYNPRDPILLAAAGLARRSFRGWPKPVERPGGATAAKDKHVDARTTAGMP